MAIGLDNARMMWMISTGLNELLNPFDGKIEEVRADLMHDTMQVRVWARVRIAGDIMAQGSKIDHFRLRDEPHEAVNFAIYDLLTAFIPEEDIKEAVADELLPPGVLEQIEKAKTCR